MGKGRTIWSTSQSQLPRTAVMRSLRVPSISATAMQS